VAFKPSKYFSSFPDGHSADVNALDIKNRTPLHCVSELGHVGAAQVLLEHGVDANARDANNATPLHLASNPDYD
jgi:ankyrin repeat protein